jgi:hypothetical protein
LILVLAALALASSGSDAVATGGKSRPLLRVLETSPLVIRGVAFKPHEHVRAVVFANSRVVRLATASGAGTFTLRFLSVDANACAGFTVTAIGDHGSRATFKRPPGQCAALEPPTA